MMEGNYGDTSLTTRSSPNYLDLPSSSADTTTMHTATGVPRGQMALTHLSPRKGGGAAQGGCTGCVDSGGMGREGGEGGCILAWNSEALSLFSPSFLWFYGLLTGSRLSSGYERSVAEILTGSPGGEGSPAGLLCRTG